MNVLVEPLVKRNIFSSEEEAIQELVRDYVLRQVDSFSKEVRQYERKYGMNYGQFNQYLHERSALLRSEKISAEERQTLGKAVMEEEDVWLDWKVAREMLTSWLGLRQEIEA